MMQKIPEIHISNEAFNKVHAYADLCNNEISALGSVVITNGIILIEDVYLFDQIVTGSSTELSQESVANFICEYIKMGKDPANLKFWWHSHVNMNVFWSGTDTATIERFAPSDWFISMVSNKRGEYKIRLDIHNPLRLVFDDIPLIRECDKSNYKDIRSEIDKKVKCDYLPIFRKAIDSYQSSGSVYPQKSEGCVIPPLESLPVSPAHPNSFVEVDTMISEEKSKPIDTINIQTSDEKAGLLKPISEFEFTPDIRRELHPEQSDGRIVIKDAKGHIVDVYPPERKRSMVDKFVDWLLNANTKRKI